MQTARIGLDSPDWMTKAAGDLWVKLDGGTIVRIDTDKARVAQRVAARGPDDFGLCQGLGNSGDAVWSCTPYGSIERIEAATGRVSDVLVTQMRSDQGHLVVADGKLWLIQRSGSDIAGIDLGDKTLGEPVALGASCTELAAADPIIWAACPADSQVLRLDARTGEVTARFSLPVPREVAIGEDLWIGYDDGIAQVDPETLTVEAVYDSCFGGGIWVGRDLVWARCEGGPFLIGIDPAAHQVVTTVIADGLPSGGNVIGVGKQLWATASDDLTLVRIRPPG